MIDLTPTPLHGAFVLRHRVIRDDRGDFLRLVCRQTLARFGLVADFPQQNYSNCRSAGILRGLHYQVPPAAEAKLLHCVRGGVFDVMVDMRRGSPTFLQWFGVELSEDEPTSVYVPPGFAHGYQSLAEGSAVIYQSSASYAPESERQLRYDDPRVGIDWPIGDPLLSDKDRSIPDLDDSFAGIDT